VGWAISPVKSISISYSYTIIDQQAKLSDNKDSSPLLSYQNLVTPWNKAESVLTNYIGCSPTNWTMSWDNEPFYVYLYM
jgi:hypothetical protein